MFCLKFSAVTACLFDLNLGQQIPSGTVCFHQTGIEKQICQVSL